MMGSLNRLLFSNLLITDLVTIDFRYLEQIRYISDNRIDEKEWGD